MLDELARFQPAILEGNPSLLSRLARWVTRAGASPFRPALIGMTYEYPSLLHRRHLQAAFGAPLMSSYGSTEAAYVFVECEQGRLHQNVASCRVDFLPFRAPLASPDSSSVGKLLVTTFDNPWRALIRFDPGDLGRLAEGPCPCGRTEGLTLSSIEGRAINLTLTPDGRVVTQADVDRRLAELEGLDEYQLLQTDPRSYTLGVVSDSGAPQIAEQVAAQAERALAELYGPGAQVTVTRASGFGPEVSGKYRLVKAQFPIDANTFIDPSFQPPLPAEARVRSEAP
jgi:phenylacetate-CoA ligase